MNPGEVMGANMTFRLPTAHVVPPTGHCRCDWGKGLAGGRQGRDGGNARETAAAQGAEMPWVGWLNGER